MEDSLDWFNVMSYDLHGQLTLQDNLHGQSI